MASASYSEDLTCAVCLTIFTDPVNLPCGHSFCRECITDVLSSQQRCPQCRTAVLTEAKSLPTSHILKSLAEKTKEAEKMKEEHGNEKAEVAELCPEHDEKLKLFCVTDQQLACTICRDGEKHKGHEFKPIKEAAASLRQELEKGMENLCDDILATESLTNTQRGEITKTEEKSQLLKTQIQRQFEEMHQFLRKREDEIKNELKHKEEDAVEKMNKTLNAIETALSESRELQGKVTLVLEITDSARFLKSWTEGNSMTTVEHLFRPRANDLQVVNTSLCLGPYESQLQFFTWKEMLQVIQPRAELLSLKSNSTDVSDDGGSLFSSPKSNQAQTTTPPSSSEGFGQTTTPPSFSDGFGRTTIPPSSREGFGQTTTPPSFSDGFGQTTTPPSFNKGFGQTMIPPSFNKGFGQTTTPPSFKGFGQTMTPPPFSKGFGQTMTPPSFKGFGQTTTPTSFKGFGQTTTAPSFSKGFGQTTTAPSFNKGFGQTVTPPSFKGFGQTVTPPSFKGFGQTMTPPFPSKK